jgi:hypothetical protein
LHDVDEHAVVLASNRKPKLVDEEVPLGRDGADEPVALQRQLLRNSTSQPIRTT